MIDLCVINHNTADLLERFVASVYEKKDSSPEFTLSIADNDSPDRSKDMLKEMSAFFEIRGVNVKFNANIGYSAAAAQLAELGNGDIIGICNADVWLDQDDLAKIQKAFDEDETIAILGPKQRNEKGVIVHAGIVGENEKPRHRGWNSYDPTDIMYKDSVDCITISGSAYFIRRSVWDELASCPTMEKYNMCNGAFLNTPHYYEETWCSYHAREHGHRVVYDGNISIGHTWHASSKVGGEADKFFPISQKLFRDACDLHGISRD